MMMKYFVITAAFMILFLSMCCKDEPTKPPNEIIKNPREYTWTVDTLAYPGSMQTSMRDIWASSSSDVYVVGHNDQPGPGTMFHYNGNSWTTTHFHSADGGTISGAVDLFGIYGFSSNDVYAVGERIYDNPKPPPNFLDSSLIIHFNGAQWVEISIPRGRYLSSVWGANSQDVWAGGARSLYHYHSGQWNKIAFDSFAFVASIWGLSSSDVYFSTVKEDVFQPNDSLTYQLWHYDGNALLLFDSFMVTPTNLQEKFGYYLWQVEQTLYSSGYGVYIMENNQWRQFLDNEYPLHIGGSSRNNIFAVGDFGRIFHWNGTDWLRLTAIENPSVQYLSVWVDNREALIVGNDGTRSYILHGR